MKFPLLLPVLGASILVSDVLSRAKGEILTKKNLNDIGQFSIQLFFEKVFSTLIGPVPTSVCSHLLSWFFMA